MGQTFSIKYGVNEGLTFSPSELMEQYLYGIDVKSKDGTILSENVIRQKILNAQSMIENYLSVKLFRQVYTERVDFVRGDYYNWGFFKVAFPVRSPLQLYGYIGTVQQIQYPLSWASAMQSSDEKMFGRTMHIVPAGSTTSNQGASVVFSGITPHLGFMGVDTIPNYWSIKYDTGFNEIPGDILDVIGKMAAIPILAMLGDIVVGTGLSSMSLSIDGLSQSMSRSGASAFAERIRVYQQELFQYEGLKHLQDFYRGINFMVL